MYHRRRDLTESEKKDLVRELYHVIVKDIREKDVAMLYNIYAERHHKPKLLHCGIDEILNKDNYESIKEILGHLAIGFNDAHAYKMETRKGYFVSGDSARELVKDELINVAMWLFNTEKVDDHHIVALHDILEKYEMPRK